MSAAISPLLIHLHALCNDSFNFTLNQLQVICGEEEGVVTNEKSERFERKNNGMF
jgi:hypothetical protein